MSKFLDLPAWTWNNMKTSFVDYYSKNNISPVSQDISDIEKHYQRRESLFLSIGIMPNLVKGKSVIEFGPGSGHNALYTASLSPSIYHLVDGNPKGVSETQNLLKGAPVEDLKVDLCLFDEFQSSNQYDIVWAEGCLPHQKDPFPLMKHISTFTAENGCMVVTTVDSISYLSETLRRLVKEFYVVENSLLEEQLQNLTPIFEPHLKKLKGMSRPVEDWILDSIIQPLEEVELLSIPEVIQCLSSDFDVLGSSPKFITDWRWYKDVVGEDREFNQIATDSYYKNNLNLLDYRFEFPPHSVEFGKRLEKECVKTWSLMKKIQKTEEGWNELWVVLENISVLIDEFAPQSAAAIREASLWLQNEAPAHQILQHFPSWWGRGQQYVSLIKKNEQHN